MSLAALAMAAALGAGHQASLGVAAGLAQDETGAAVREEGYGLGLRLAWRLPEWFSFGVRYQRDGVNHDYGAVHFDTGIHRLSPFAELRYGVGESFEAAVWAGPEWSLLRSSVGDAVKEGPARSHVDGGFLGVLAVGWRFGRFLPRAEFGVAGRAGGADLWFGLSAAFLAGGGG